MMIRLIMFSTLAVLTVPMMASADVVVVDKFYDGEAWTLTESNKQTDFGPTDRIIGGQRDTTFTVVNGTPSLSHLIAIESGVIDYRSSQNGGQATWYMEYGMGSDLDANMLYEARVMFSVKIRYKNISDGVPLSITVTSNKGEEGNEKTQTVTKFISGVVSHQGPPGGESLTIEFPYSEYDQVDFTDVDYLRFAFGGDGNPLPNGLDLVTGDWRNCPEPVTLSLLALGGLALLRGRRRFGG